MENAPFKKFIFSLAIIFAVFFIYHKSAFAASISSTQSGNWSATSTWVGGVVPGNGDTVTLATGNTVTVNVNTTVGTSGTSSTSNTPAVNTSGTAQLIIPTGVTFTIRGNFETATSGGIFPPTATPVVIMNPGSNWIFDASAAASPSSTDYSFYAGNFGNWVFIQANCTLSQPCSITSNASGGAGYFTGYPATIAGGIVASHVNFSRIGNSTNAAILATFASGAYASSTFQVTYSTFDHCGQVEVDSAGADANIVFSNNVFTNSQTLSQTVSGASVDAAFNFSNTLSGGGVRTVNNNVFDGVFGENTNSGGNLGSDTISPGVGLTITNNYFPTQPLLSSGGGSWASFQNNIIVDNYGNSLTAAGDIINNFLFQNIFTEVHHHDPDVPSTLSTFSDLGNIFQTSYLVSNINVPQDGIVDDEIPGSTQAITAKNNIILPTGDGNGSSGLADLIGNDNATYDLEHNTLEIPLSTAAVSMECESGCSGPVSHRGTLSNNIFWFPASLGTSHTTATDFNIEAPVTDLFNPTTAILNNVRTSNLLQTLPPGSGSNTNQGNSYAGAWSVTPGSSDIVGDPSFVDTTRGLPTFDTAYLNNVAGSTWASHASTDTFTSGQIVSDATSTYFGGVIINYRVSTTTPFTKNTANSEPGIGSAWHNYWEFASLNDLRTAISNGTSYTDPLNSSATTTAIQTLEHWVQAGYQPTNVALKNAGTDSITIGAESFMDTTPPGVSITNPTASSTVSGSVTLTAVATDDVAVQGVQFKIDGVNFGSQVTSTSSPNTYTLSWNTASSTNASHLISAIATDTSSNTASTTLSVTVNNLSVPTPPQSLTGTATNTAVSLSWSAPASNNGSNLIQYIVQDKLTASSTFATVANTSTTTLTSLVSGLTNGSSYDFQILAQNGSGTSSPSNIFTATPATIPGAPTSAVATAGNATSTVTFIAPGSNGGSSITGYTVTSSPGGGTDTNTGTTALTHLITGLANGTPYTFTVTATNAIGTSTPSVASNSVTPNPPSATTYTFTGPSSGNAGAASTNFTVTPNGIYNGTITITPTGSGSTGLSATVLTFVSTSTPQTFTITPTVAGTITLTPTNNGSLANPSNLTYTVNALVPSSPTSVSATAGNASATVSFTAPAFNGGSAILFYTASSSPSGINATSATTSILVNGLANGTPYTFKVTATNAAGTSTPSSASNSVTPTPILTGITPTTLPNATTTIAYSQILTATGGGSPYTWSLLSGTLPTGLSLNTGSTVATTTISGTPTAPGLSNFTIQVSSGASSTSQSYGLTVVSTSTAPQLLTGIATSTQVSLSWSAPASSNGSNLTQYIVQDKLTASSTFATAATISTTTLTSIVSGLTNGTSYDFQVLAQNGVGTSSPSNTFTIIPNIVPVISSTTASSISTSGATITWTTDRVSDSQVAYGTSSGTYTSTTTLSEISPMVTSHSVNLTGLSAATNYYYIVISTDNNIATSTENSFTTTAASSGGGGGGGGGGSSVIYPIISNIQIASSSSTSVALTWTTDYQTTSEVDYGTTTSYGLMVNDTVATTTHSALLTNLTNGTVYHFRIKASLSFGGTTVSGDYSFTAGAVNQVITQPVTPTTTTPGSTTSPQTPGLPYLGGSAASIHLVNDQGTYYIIQNGLKQGVTSPGILFSYGLTFSDAQVPSSADLSSPNGPLLLPDNGSLVKSKEDQTVYLISDGQRHPFISARIFLGLGFKFSNVLLVTNPELQALPKAVDLSSSTAAHMDGTNISYKGTIYWIDNGLRHPYPSLAVWNSWHLHGNFSDVIPASTADLALPLGDEVVARVRE